MHAHTIVIRTICLGSNSRQWRAASIQSNVKRMGCIDRFDSIKVGLYLPLQEIKHTEPKESERQIGMNKLGMHTSSDSRQDIRTIPQAAAAHRLAQRFVAMSAIFEDFRKYGGML